VRDGGLQGHGLDEAGEFAFEVPPAAAGTTLAAFLRGRFANLTWSQAKNLCRSGRVTVDDELTLDDVRRLISGETVRLVGEGERLVTDDGVRYLDADVVVVVKPAGLLTVPFEDGDRDTLWHRASVAVRRREKAAGGSTRSSGALRAVQRLDKETSGLVVFARSIDAQRELQLALKDAKSASGAPELERAYEALVLGRIRAAARYETWLVENRGDGRRGSFRPREGALRPPAAAKHAITLMEPLEVLGEKGARTATHVRARLLTGRTHQIRIHLAEAGHPVLGDPVYGKGTAAAEWPGGLMLHAARLGFRHPRGGRPMTFDEPPPAAFASALAALREPARS
jgi:23S rRNA pseudouridine1911/1915/1917 synthase